MKEIYKCDSYSILRYILEGIHSNMYLLDSKRNSVIIVDPFECEEALEYIIQRSVNEVIILLTHEHYDHISGVNYFRKNLSDICDLSVICQKFCAENIIDPDKSLARFWDIIISGLDENDFLIAEKLCNHSYSCKADISYDNIYEFEWNACKIVMKHAPGHSQGGSLIYVDDKVMFSGDNLTNGNGVICRWPGGSKSDYLDITKPMILETHKEMLICPGHGDDNYISQLLQYTEMYRKKVQ